jgi:hypothetical protein
MAVIHGDEDRLGMNLAAAEREVALPSVEIISAVALYFCLQVLGGWSAIHKYPASLGGIKAASLVSH